MMFPAACDVQHRTTSRYLILLLFDFCFYFSVAKYSTEQYTFLAA